MWFLLSLVWDCRMVTLQLSGLCCVPKPGADALTQTHTRAGAHSFQKAQRPIRKLAEANVNPQ